MSTVFVDTSALLALLDRSDPRHDRVRQTFLDLEDASLVTHGYVVAEAVAVARRRFGVDGAMMLIDDLLPVIDLLPVAPTDHASALGRYRASLPSGTSFVDQVSLLVMERDSIDFAFALDADFVSAGIAILPHL